MNNKGWYSFCVKFIPPQKQLMPVHAPLKYFFKEFMFLWGKFALLYVLVNPFTNGESWYQKEKPKFLRVLMEVTKTSMVTLIFTNSFSIHLLVKKKKKGSSFKLNGKPKQGMSEGSVWWRQLQALSLHGIGHQPCDSSRESRDICPILRYSIFSITLMSVTFLDQS